MSMRATRPSALSATCVARGELQRQPVRQPRAVVRGQRGQRPPRDRTQLRSSEFADAPMRVEQRRERALRAAQLQARRLKLMPIRPVSGAHLFMGLTPCATETWDIGCAFKGKGCMARH